MRTEFIEPVLGELLGDGTLNRESSILAVCAEDAGRNLFLKLGFSDVTLSNIDDRMEPSETYRRFAPFEWSFQDAQALSYDDGQFDYAFVAEGLHHCSSPHRALLEMYRVAHAAS